MPARRMRRRLEVRYGVNNAECAGYSGNVSVTGIMVRCTRVFAPGTILNIELMTRNGVLRLRGAVSWAREGSVQLLPTGRVGMGIKFIDPPPDLLARLE
ncbi:MAG TPA: PilZ domain-containing protein [Candidatus Polarisedimenticolia bacterium]|nr:PilZ domain-containing protein [Candidatus Polarisedimenticolia bacterium]